MYGADVMKDQGKICEASTRKVGMTKLDADIPPPSLDIYELSMPETSRQRSPVSDSHRWYIVDLSKDLYWASGKGMIFRDDLGKYIEEVG